MRHTPQHIHYEGLVTTRWLAELLTLFKNNHVNIRQIELIEQPGNGNGATQTVVNHPSPSSPQQLCLTFNYGHVFQHRNAKSLEAAELTFEAKLQKALAQPPHSSST